MELTLTKTGQSFLMEKTLTEKELIGNTENWKTEKNTVKFVIY